MIKLSSTSLIFHISTTLQIKFAKPRLPRNTQSSKWHPLSASEFCILDKIEESLVDTLKQWVVECRFTTTALLAHVASPQWTRIFRNILKLWADCLWASISHFEVSKFKDWIKISIRIKSWEPFRIYLLNSAANPADIHPIGLYWLC